MPVVSYAEFVRLRENNTEELGFYKIAMVNPNADPTQDWGPKIIVPGTKIQKWRGRGYVPVDEEAGEAVRRALEKAHNGGIAPRMVPQTRREELMQESLTKLKARVRALGLTATGNLSKGDLVGVILAHEPEATPIPAAPPEPERA